MALKRKADDDESDFGSNKRPHLTECSTNSFATTTTSITGRIVKTVRSAVVARPTPGPGSPPTSSISPALAPLVALEGEGELPGPPVDFDMDMPFPKIVLTTPEGETISFEDMPPGQPVWVHNRRKEEKRRSKKQGNGRLQPGEWKTRASARAHLKRKLREEIRKKGRKEGAEAEFESWLAKILKVTKESGWTGKGRKASTKRHC